MDSPVKMRSFELDPFALPKLPGVKSLSVEEVRNDLRELQGGEDDTDSDCSVCSKDVLSSIYPVKPRSYCKIPSKDAASFSRRQDGEYESSGGAVFDEALAFIKNVHINHSALYVQELEREKLENMSKWYEESLATDKKQSSTIRSEEESYIKAMQGLYVRALKYQQSLGEQNMMVRKLLNALKERREATQTLDNEIEKVKSLMSTKRGNKSTSTAGVVTHLKVHLNHEDSDVVLFVGQVIHSPYGKGTIESIDSVALVVSIILPFGKMYSHISRVVCWSDWSNGADFSSESALIQHYDTVHASSVMSIPWSEKIAIRDLVSSVASEEDSGTVTDKEDNENESESDTHSDDEDDSDSVQSQTNEIAEFITHISDSTQNGQSNSSTATSTATTAVRPLTSGASVFPIVNSVPASQSRREVKRKLLADRSLELVGVSTENLQLAFAPPAALPHLIGSSSSKKAKNTLKFDISALDDPVTTSLGSTGALCFEGDVANLKSSLQTIGNQIAQLRNTNLQHAKKMNYNRTTSARLSAETAALRVGMFTRRIVHRNNLGSAGAVYGAPPTNPGIPCLSQEVKVEESSVVHDGMDIVKEENVTEADYLSSTSHDEVVGVKLESEGVAGSGDKDDSPVENKKKAAKRTRRSY